MIKWLSPPPPPAVPKGGFLASPPSLRSGGELTIDLSRLGPVSVNYINAAALVKDRQQTKKCFYLNVRTFICLQAMFFTCHQRFFPVV